MLCQLAVSTLLTITLNPVTRVTSTHSTERSELTGVSKLREGSIINSDQDDLGRIN